MESPVSTRPVKIRAVVVVMVMSMVMSMSISMVMSMVMLVSMSMVIRVSRKTPFFNKKNPYNLFPRGF